jgi:hypothetical protein
MLKTGDIVTDQGSNRGRVGIAVSDEKSEFVTGKQPGYFNPHFFTSVSWVGEAGAMEHPTVHMTHQLRKVTCSSQVI